MKPPGQLAASAGPIGTLFNLMRFAVNDGPGIRTTVFLKGCPLTCVWCHNPESQMPAPEVMFAPERCIACGECVRTCHHDALHWDGEKPVREAERCQLCGECCEACVSEARRRVGYRAAVPELLEQILRDRIIFEESGGGVTFSGGEPLLQAEFLCAMLTACRSEGIHTAVDTCGYAQVQTFSRVSEQADLLLFDLKLMNSDRHRQYTGVGNGVILKNLRSAVDMGKSLIVRIPIVPGVNDHQGNISATVKFLESAGVRNVDLLAYHETGVEKYRRLESEYPQELIPPTDAQMKGLCDQFAARGFVVRIGG